MNLQLTDNLWELKFNEILDANISPHYLGNFTNNFLVINVTSTGALPVWKQGGSIGQAIEFENDFAYGEIKPLTLNSFLLFQYPLLTANEYKLYYFPLPRLIAVNLKIWEYKGATIDASVSQLISALETANLENLQLELPEVTNRLTEINASIQYLEELMTGNNTGIPLSLDAEGRLVYVRNSENVVLANLADLDNLEIPTATGGKELLQAETTFYIRNGKPLGNSGESAEEAFSSIEEALINLSNRYEIANHLILDFDSTHTLNCSFLPNFTGAGRITFKGNGTEVTFVKFEGSTEVRLSNWAGLDLFLEDIDFKKGSCTKFTVEGGKMNFKNVDFDTLNVELVDCRTTYLESCSNSNNQSSFIAIRSTIELKLCNLIAQFIDCQATLRNCVFSRFFKADTCTLILQNPRFDNRYATGTALIINSTVQFLSSWLTFANLSNGNQIKSLIAFENCTLKDFPSNIDLTGNRTFYEASILRFINCLTPENFNNVNYNFSNHNFINGAAAIELVNTAILKELNVNGGGIKRDDFSILGNTNYSSDVTDIPANTLRQAVDYLWSLINS